MLSRSTISYIQSLKQKKYRQKYNNFLLEGEKLVLEALSEGIIQIRDVYVLEKYYKKLGNLRDDITLVSNKDMVRISNMKTPPGVIAVADIPDENDEVKLKDQAKILYLDEIKDPGNLGTLIRTAEWFGFRDIVLSPNCVEWFNPKVIQSSMGSYSRVRRYHKSFAQLRGQLDSHHFIAADLDGIPFRNYQIEYPLVLIIGSESHGVSKDILIADISKIKIDSAEGSMAESLNAAVAGAVIMSKLSGLV